MSSLDPKLAEAGSSRGSREFDALTLAFMDGESVLAEAAEGYRVMLGDPLVAAYALGSLAHARAPDPGLNDRERLASPGAAELSLLAR